MRKAKQSTAKNVMVLMVDSTDHVTGKTGLTLTITASKDGGAFASITPTVTERGSGWYALALTTAHTDTLGDLALHITGTAADPSDMVLLVEAGATDSDVSTRLATAGYTAPPTASAIRTEIDANSTKLDATVSSRLAAAGYTAPDNATVALIYAAIAAIPAAPSAVTNAGAVRTELAEELIAMVEVWRRLGLDIATPLTQTATAITAGTINLAITGDPDTSVTVTRQP